MSSSKKSPRLVLPKIAPYKAVSEYKLSQNMQKMVKLYPEFDVLRQNDTTSYLGILQRRLYDVEHKIKSKRKNMNVIRRDLDAQWNALDEKEKSLRENFEHFDQFVRENIEKRERASKKIQDDLVLCAQRQRDIDELNSVMGEMKQVKILMDEKIRQYQHFEKFLENVVDETDFLTNVEIINRYLSLVSARNYMAEIQESNLRALENARNDMIKLMEEKNFIIMGLNNQIANLQSRFETATIKALESEGLVTQIKNSAVKQMDEIDEAKASIWNIYQHMVLSKKHPSKIKKEQVEEQMKYIKRTLSELAKVNQILKRRTKLGSKNKIKP